ncbi:MAG: hypothetical protein SEPTF4163_005541 [Sporothrix epigloea]
MLILHVSDAHAANKICANGIAWKSMLFNCEPYCAAAQVTRCYNCHAYGHTSNFCKAKAKCGHCAGDAHAEGAQCPKPRSESKCLNCRGDHPVWHPDCPVFAKHREIAGSAYNARPQCFPDPIDPEPLKPTITNQTKPTAAPDDDEYMIVEGRKRRALKTPRRGRPPKAVQEPRRLTFQQDEAAAVDLTTDNNTIEKFFGKTSTNTEPTASTGKSDSQSAGDLTPLA